MKKINSILLLTVILSKVCLGNRPLQLNPQFVEKLDEDDPEWEYKKVFSVKIKNWSIAFLNPIAWQSKDSDLDVCKISFLNVNTKPSIFINFSSWESWETKFQRHSKIKTSYFLYLKLGENNHILALNGSMCNSGNYGCPLLTLIHLSEEEAPKLIFNTHVRLLEIIKTDENTRKLRVRFGIYEYDLPAKYNDHNQIVPCNPDDVYVCDIYIKNNELIVERLPFTHKQVYDTFSKEDLEASYT